MGRSLVLSVSVGPGCYRHIRISDEVTLQELSSEILFAFNFFDDHMHSFFMNGRAWDSDSEYVCPGGELDGARGFTNKVKLSMFHFNKGDKFLYIFDYGDEWQFQIKVLRVIDEPTLAPLILKSVGTVVQYDDEYFDEEEEDEDDEEEEEEEE
ncbi:MAG: plasmid pRiA4b ORF-3 family protein [Peptococcaceae bacterium]|nr:plasmid pRiA4b ORF-3 family protein [Peptococcaceae bacterium]